MFLARLFVDTTNTMVQAILSQFDSRKKLASKKSDDDDSEAASEAACLLRELDDGEPDEQPERDDDDDKRAGTVVGSWARIPDLLNEEALSKSLKPPAPHPVKKSATAGAAATTSARQPARAPAVLKQPVYEIL